jgi:hypothetical protein
MSLANPTEDGASGFRKVDANGHALESAPVVADPASPPAAGGEQVVTTPAAAPKASEPQEPVLYDSRSRIYARFNRDRAQEQNGNKTVEATEQDVESAMVDPREIPEGVAMPPRPVPAKEQNVNEAAPGESPATAPQPEARLAPSSGYQLKVNGNAFQVSREDLLRYAGVDEADASGLPDVSLVRAAQINLAAQMRLDEAKQASSGARAARAPGDTQPEQPQPSQDRTEPQAARTPARVTREEVEAIQLGDPEEAAKVLEGIVAKVVDQRAHQRTIEQRANEIDQELRTAIADFGVKNPDLAANDLALDFVRSQIVREAIADIEKVVVVQPDERAELLNKPELVTLAYKNARLQGRTLRTPAEMFEAAGARVRQAMNLQAVQPAPAAAPFPSQARLEAKRALPMQPVRAGAMDQLSRPTAPQERRPVSETRQMMRAMRQGKSVRELGIG